MMDKVYVLLEDYGDGSSLSITVYGELKTGLAAWSAILNDEGVDTDALYINTWNGREASYIDASVEIRLEIRAVL